MDLRIEDSKIILRTQNPPRATESKTTKNSKSRLPGAAKLQNFEDADYLTSEESFQGEDEEGLEEDYYQDEDEEADYLAKRKIQGRKQKKTADEDDDLGWEEEYGYVNNHYQDESLMTERQRAKQQRENQAALSKLTDDDPYSNTNAAKKVKNIYNMEQLARKQELDEARKTKQKDANDRLMEETVQKILNEFSNKKSKLSLTEKREKKRAELYSQKVELRFLFDFIEG